MLFQRRVFALAAIVSVGLAGSSKAAEPAAWEAKLTEAIPEAMKQASVPGAIVGIWQDGAEPYVRAFGVRDIATGEPMETDLYTRIGSVTKTFVTTAVLQLVDRGKVGLDDPISKYVDGVPNGDNITIRQLAAMRSGLFSYSDVTNPMLPSQPERKWTPRELLEISFNHPPLFPPDAKFDYSNTNTVLLGLVVEKVSGQSLSAFIDEHIARPEGLGHTRFPDGATLPSPHTHGYLRTEDGKVVDTENWNPSWGWAAGEMISTVHDLQVWARDLATGKLLSPATQSERERFQLAPSEGDGSLYGLGLEYQNGWLGHNGNISGYQTYAYCLPAQRTTLVVVLNSSIELVGVWNMIRDIVGIVTPDHPWPAPPKEP
jgi:D-alanyl-D-alanine carboxypeptidase